mgnify:FL=1
MFGMASLNPSLDQKSVEIGIEIAHLASEFHAAVFADTRFQLFGNGPRLGKSFQRQRGLRIMDRYAGFVDPSKKTIQQHETKIDG